jgi:hypothetical protein
VFIQQLWRSLQWRTHLQSHFVAEHVRSSLEQPE